MSGTGDFQQDSGCERGVISIGTHILNYVKQAGAFPILVRICIS